MNEALSWNDLDERLLEAALPVRRAVREGKSVLMVGPEGCGKTLIARRLVLDRPLPQPRKGQLCEQAVIYRLAGLGGVRGIYQPFRAPHHTVSMLGMMGAPVDWRPGEVSLATGGVLFLDDVPEFQQSVLEATRAVYADKRVMWCGLGVQQMLRTSDNSDSGPTIIGLAADFQLVGAMSPCPCGRLGTRLGCTCDTAMVERYRERVNGMFEVTVQMTGRG